MRETSQLLVRTANTTPTITMMMSRSRQKRSCTSGGRSRTLTRGSCSSPGWPAHRIPSIRPNEFGFLSSSASSLATGGEVIGWFHVAPIGITRVGSGPGRRSAPLGGVSSGTSVVAMSPKIPSPSLGTGSAGLPDGAAPRGSV